MIGKYARVMNAMNEMAEGLREQQHYFLNDKDASIAIGEAIRALKGSAAQMRSAERKHSNARNPLSTTNPPNLPPESQL